MNDGERIGQIALSVAYATDNQAQCVFGVALLCETALHFGYDLTPRAVSMVAQRVDVVNAPPVVTGQLARDYVAAHGGSSAIGETVGAVADGSEFQRAGHMIATFESHELLIDPTFGQFTHAGLPDVVPVTGFDPSDAESAMFEDDHVRVLYLFDGSNQGWQDGYEFARHNSRHEAAQIAQHLRANGEPHTHPIRFTQ
jgi:hypothetical protein